MAGAARRGRAGWGGKRDIRSEKKYLVPWFGEEGGEKRNPFLEYEVRQCPSRRMDGWMNE